MPGKDILCEVASVRTTTGVCPGSARCRQGDTFILGARTPEPSGLCGRAFHALHPMAFAMRWSDKMEFEKGDFVEITCPDGFVTFRLSRVQKK